ncbi:MAG: MMPL family transporter [Deltaproteobacteria bacterium]|nr:MMPL family transporter [Deltaproteobacteria bacterium]
MTKWVGFNIRYFWIFLVLGGLVAWWSIPKTIALYKNISTDLISLLPDHYPAVQEIHKIRDKLEDSTVVSITLEGRDPEKIEGWLESLAGDLKTCPLVERLETEKTGYDFFYDHKLLFLELPDLQTLKERLDRQIQRKKLSGLFIDLGEDQDEDFEYGDLEEKYRGQAEDGASSSYFRNKDKTLYTLFAFAKGTDTSIAYNKRFYEQVESCAQKWIGTLGGNKPDNMYFTGKAKNRVDEYDTLIHDLGIAGFVSLAAILILLLAYFRSLSAPFLIFIPLGIGLFAAFGISSYLVDRLNIITAFLYSVLSGLGVENGIHFLARYNYERGHGSNMKEALGEVMEKTGRSIGFSVAAVSAIFLSLILNDFKGFSQFGLIAGVGLLCVYGSYLLFFAPLVVLFEKLKFLRKPTLPLLSRVTLKSFLSPRFILWAGVILTVFSIVILFSRPLFEYDFSRLKPRLPQSTFAKAKYRETVDKLVGPAVVLVYSKEEAKALKQAVLEKIKTDKESPTLESILSYFDFYQEDEGEKLALLKEIENILDDPTLELVPEEKRKDLERFKQALRETTPIEEKEIPPEVLKIFKGAKGEGAFAFIQSKKEMSLDDGKNGLNLLEDVGEIKTPIKTFHAVSDPLIFANVLKTMMRDAPRAIGLAVLIILFLLWLDQRDFKKTLLVALPIILGEIWLIGFLFLSGLKLDFYSMVIIPAIMGMSIDNCIHIYHRYKEAGRGSIAKVIQTAGLASLIASTTNALGFLGLAFANHGGLASLGKVAILGLLATLLSTVVFFPAFLVFLEKRRGT